MKKIQFITKENLSEFNARLLSIITQKKMSYLELAKRSRIDKQTIYNWNSERGICPSNTSLKKIAAALNISIETLTQGQTIDKSLDDELFMAQMLKKIGSLNPEKTAQIFRYLTIISNLSIEFKKGTITKAEFMDHIANIFKDLTSEGVN